MTEPDEIDTLPRVSKIESTARVGEQQEPAVVIWFEPGDRALRYRWSDGAGEILEETYHDGVVVGRWSGESHRRAIESDAVERYGRRQAERMESRID